MAKDKRKSKEKETTVESPQKEEVTRKEKGLKKFRVLGRGSSKTIKGKWGSKKTRSDPEDEEGKPDTRIDIEEDDEEEDEDEPVQEKSKKEVKKWTRKKKKAERDVEKGEEESDETTFEEFPETFDPNSGGQVVKTTSSALLSYRSSGLLAGQGQENVIWNLVILKPPVQREEKEWEQMLLLTYYPTHQPIPIVDKLHQNNVNLRHIEEEGIFIDSPLKISRRNLLLLENRLFNENSLGWFGHNGKLLSLPDPYRPEPMRILGEFYSPYTDNKVVFVPAKIDDYFQTLQFDSREGGYELILELGSIQFKHHSLFSKEHVLASQLESKFRLYSQRREINESERLRNRIKGLRGALSNCKQALGSLAEDGGQEELENLRSKLASTRETLKKLRVQRDNSFREDRMILASVLNEWRTLKSLRNEQGYANTSLKLNVHKCQLDPSQGRAKLAQEIKEEVDDLREEFEAKQLRRMAKSKSRRRNNSGGDGLESSEESSQNTKPSKKFNEAEAKEIALKRLKELGQNPEDPVITLELTKNNPITALTSLPAGCEKEMSRRKSLQKVKIELRVCFNKREVYRFPPKEINDKDFSVLFEVSIPIRVNEWPDSLHCELYEISSLLGQKNHIDDIDINFPSSKTSIERAKMEWNDFANERVIKSGGGVGSGVAFSIMGTNYDGPFTSGSVAFRVGWSKDKDGNIQCPKAIEKKEDVGRERDDKMREILDPNNPKYLKSGPRQRSESVEFKEDFETLKEGVVRDDSQRFSLDGEMKEFEFCTTDEIEKNPRIRLLQLRDKGVPEFRGIKFVSLNEGDISPKVFEAYEKRLKEEARARLGSSEEPKRIPSWRSTEESEILFEVNRLDRLRDMRRGVLQLFQSHMKQLTFEDIVSEEQIPDLGTLGLNIMSLFQPRRPLRPTRKERKRVQGFALIDTKISLIVNIVRAFNLPSRKDTELYELSTEAITGVQIRNKRLGGGGLSSGGHYSTVKPFVEIWFQRNVCRTTTALGSNPTWNQELHLTLQDDSQFPESLGQLDDLIYLLVYDEVAVDLLQDDRRKDTDVHQRMEKRWLGSITIPFSTLYTNGRIEGTFKINSPSILLGYEAQGMATHFGPQMGGVGSNKGKNLPISNQKSAYITLFIALHPAIHPSAAIKEDCASGEPADILAHVKAWRNSYLKKFPERSIQPLVMTSDGDTILSTRFLKPIKPPDVFLENTDSLMKTLIQLAHYVSLFPSVRDSTLGITDYNLWFTSDVFVMNLGGGTGDHAVLLACFFLYLKIPCWIIQGNSIPDGRTSFVLTSFKGIEGDYVLRKSLKNAILIWNPCTGEHYNASDSFCPIQQVWGIVGTGNIWANVSKEGERPHQIDWDIGKSKQQWSSLFSKGFTESKLISVQPQSIKYKRPDQNQANSLAQRVERHLKDAFMKWRKSSRTNWNRYCSSILRRLLPKLEEIKSGNLEAQIEQGAGGGVTESNITIQSGSHFNLNDEHLDELREINTTHQMIGFPLHQAYTNMESLAEVVYATGLHTIDTPNLEFAIAAYAEAFPANVYSVWIYVAALHKRK